MALWGTMRDLTYLWGVTKQRAGQIVADLDVPAIGSRRDKRVDLEAALRRRPFTCSKEELERVLENAKKTHRAFLASQFDAEEEDFTPGSTVPTQSHDALAAKLAAASGEGAEQVREGMTLNTEFRRARAEKMRLDVEKARLKLDQEAGALIDRETVRQAGHAIARVLSVTAATAQEALVQKLSLAADEAQIRQIVSDSMRNWLEDVRRGLENLDAGE